MNIFASIISSIVFLIVSAFILNTFDPGNNLDIHFLPIVCLALTTSALIYSLFYFLYSSINLVFGLHPPKNELWRRGVLVTMSFETLFVLKVLGLLTNIFLVGLIVLIPITMEWFLIEINRVDK